MPTRSDINYSFISRGFSALHVTFERSPSPPNFNPLGQCRAVEAHVENATLARDLAPFTDFHRRNPGQGRVHYCSLHPPPFARFPRLHYKI